MPFKDFAEFSAGPLQLPYRGKVYELPEITVELGIRLTTELADTESGLFRLPPEELFSLVLGKAVYTAMVRDKVPMSFVTRCLLTAIADFQGGRALAEATWEGASDPKALEAYLASQQTNQSDSTSTDEAN